MESGDRVVDLLRWNIPRVTLAQLGAELLWLLAAVILARWLDGQPSSAVA